MEEGCIFEVMPLMKGSGEQKKKEKKEEKNPGMTLDETDRSNKEERERERESDGGQGEETENLELEQCAGGDGLEEKGGEESGRIDIRQMKEKMGDCMSTVVENLVSLPEEDREKILSQYTSDVDEKDNKRAEITVRWAVNKLAEEKAAERERSVTEAQRGHNADSSQARRTRDEDILWEQRQEKRSVTWADMLDEGEEVEVEGRMTERREKEGKRREMSEQQQEEQEEQQEEECKRRWQEEQQEEERKRRRQQEEQQEEESKRRQQEKYQETERRQQEMQGRGKGERRREREREGERRREKERRRM